MDKYSRVLRAIEDLYSDTSQSKEYTIKDLEALKDEIDIKIDSLK